MVWIPILASDTFEAARSAAGRFGDRRIRHYWDPRRALGVALGKALGLPPSKRERGRETGVAWDVYLLYPRGARWGDAAPLPSFWMHQLEQLEGSPQPALDAAALRASVERAQQR